MRIVRAIFVLAVILTLASCAGPGVYHRVGKGETFWRICKTYGADMQEVAEMNDIRDPAEIKAGRKLFIPGASRVLKVRPHVPPARGMHRPADDDDEVGRIVVQKDRFIWPVKGEIISAYGIRNGVRHGGIDIKAREGTDIMAADSGEAVYVDSGMRGYGNIIILKHSDEFYTVYAHNKENLVKAGERVGKGAKIALVGSTGNATTSHLHFEVRAGKTVRNPLFFLP